MNLSVLIKTLESECFTRICVEVRHEAFSDCDDLKLTPDQYLHSSPFCREKKFSDQNRSCAANKKRTLEIAACGRAFCGTCPFGVTELVQPVLFQGKLAAVCYIALLPGTVSRRTLYEKARWLAEFIRLSLYAWSMNKTPRRENSASYRKRCLNYLDLHYMENISETDLAAELGLNCTYFSSLFRKLMGKTFRQALTERRIHEAKVYLQLHRDMRISRIAHMCGFSDSNYFTLVFHRTMGVAPKEYRRIMSKNEESRP